MARPKKYDIEDPIFLQKVEYLAGLGFIDVEIANVLDISKQTLNSYKKNTKFLDSIKKGKDKADKRVLDSLFKRACGFEYDETTIETIGDKVTKTKVIRKFIAPDTMAQIYWLNNRRKQDWRQNNQDATGLTDNEILELRKLAKEQMVSQI